MNLFKRKKVETSNDYYDAYKAEIGKAVEKKGTFSLANILKLEIAVLAVGVFILQENNISIELKSTPMTKNSFLPVSVQSDNIDSDLVVQLEQDVKVPTIEIREDKINNIVNTGLSMDKVYAENSEMKVLIKLLQSELDEKPLVEMPNRVIISQNN